MNTKSMFYDDNDLNFEFGYKIWIQKIGYKKDNFI